MTSEVEDGGSDCGGGIGINIISDWATVILWTLY